MSTQQTENAPLIAVPLSSFLSMELPQREFILEPVLSHQGIAILFAPRGIGKTFAALSMALAVATGNTAFKWRAPAPKKVLYVDGEMPAFLMQERLKALNLGMANPQHLWDNLSLVTPDIQQRPMPDLSTSYGQSLLEPLLHGIDMLVLDNISTLCRTGKENDAQTWQPIQSWLLDLRRRGLTVLLIHHAGKSGDQRGTSAKEDIMDTVISLKRPNEYSMTQGARFEVHLTKARSISGDLAEPFEAHLLQENSVLHWQIKDLENVELETLAKLLSEGHSIRKSGEKMGKSKSSIHRLKQKLDA